MMSERLTVLVVDDDHHILEVLEARLKSAGFDVLLSSDAQEALKKLKQKPVDLMISDIKMPGMNGFQLLNEALAIAPMLPVIFLTAYGNIPDAVQAVKAGAAEYLTKPFDGQELIRKIQAVLKTEAESDKTDPDFGRAFYVGKSQVMKDLAQRIKKVAASDVNVMILGESGVGKECVARMIHNLSARKEEAYMVVDCGSTPTGILESELFGHMKGSFTHAIREKKGLIEAASGGTLFLDEIGNISSEMQVRLLRFLEERKIRRIGDIKEIPVDCRVISATNANLVEDVKEGRFREDLYYRIKVITIMIPPLRERKEDVLVLAQGFAEAYCKTHHVPMVRLSQETMASMNLYPWPGNVRELKNAIEAGIVLCRDNILRPEDLQLPEPDHHFESLTEQQESFSLEENERSAIIRALQETGGIQKEAADLLQISRRAIHYKVKKYDIDPEEFKPKGKR